MPGLHRMSVFRDDIVFFIYLYQRWIYRKKPKRGADGSSKAARAEVDPVQRGSTVAAGAGDKGARDGGIQAVSKAAVTKVKGQ